MIAVIDYGAGNLRNVCKALEHVGTQPILTDDVGVIKRADKIVLPGVGAFADCLHGLQSRGLFEPLQQVARAGVPLLGICVGMQLLFDVGEEMGEWRGMGLIGGRIVRFNFGQRTHDQVGGISINHDADHSQIVNLKVPHIGWNQIDPTQTHPLLSKVQPGSYAYFVHSYHPLVDDKSCVIATTHYGYDFPSVVASGNIWGIQFHPEKSQDTGLQMLRNFAEAA
ncbi:MAG: imidazole glycerol phosphate synthase subunit HisH [Chloroflexi bacterium]|nr:imidazole glycerol phosphate synthase subunit HisH [Chloroflexota bacterium]